MFRRQTDEVFSTLQQVQRRLSQHTDGSAPEDVVSPTIRRVSNPNDGRRAPPPSTAAPRSATKGARKGSQYGGKFQVNEGSAEQPAHVVPVIDRSNMGNTGKVLGEQGIAEEYAPLPASPMARQPGILIRPPTALLLSVLFLGAVVGAYGIGRLSAVPPTQISATVGPAGGGIGDRSLQDIQQQKAINDARNAHRVEAQVPNPNQQNTRVSGVKPTGDYVLVLESYTQITSDRIQRMQGTAKGYNELASQHASDGYKPWFGVRKPKTGGLQLVFGALDQNVFGISKTDALAQRMEKAMRKRFPTAIWIGIR